MTTRSSASRLLLVSGVLAALLLSGTASAQAADTGWAGRLWVGTVGRYVLTDNAPFAASGFGTVELEVKGSGLGVGGDAEYRFNRWFGLDGALGYAKLNVGFTSSNAPGTVQTQGFGVAPLLLSLNVHVIHAEPVDVWVGPQIGSVMFPDNLSYPVSGSGTFSYKPTNVFSGAGFVVGTDITLSQAFAFNAALRWQNADGDGAGHLTIDPTFVTIGLTRTF